MKVLFVGKYSVASYSIAERLYKEGNEIFWMASQKHPMLENNRFHARMYYERCDIKRLKRIFQMHEIESVVFSFGEPANAEEKQNFDSMIKVLQTTLKAIGFVKLKRFILISSADLHIPGELSPWLAELRYGEELCRFYEKNAAIPLLIVRTGKVYGDFPPEYMGEPGRLLIDCWKKENIECPYSKEDYVDFICGNDVGMAVYQLISQEYTGEYQIVTGTPVKMEAFMTMLEEITGEKRCVSYSETGKTLDKQTCWQMSVKVKEDTGWMPFYQVLDKGKQIFANSLEKYKAHELQNTAKKKESLNIRSYLKKYPVLTAAFETIILFWFMELLLPFTQGTESMKYVDIRLLYVVLIAVMFGLRTGVAATVLACVSYANGLSKSGVDLTFVLYSVETWIPFIVYGIAGAGIGYMSDKKNDEVTEVKEKYDILFERYGFLKGLHKELMGIKKEFQKQITMNKDSFSKVYKIVEQLDSTKQEEVIFKAVNVVTDLLGGCSAAVWDINSRNSNFARRRTCSSEIKKELPNFLKLEEYPLMMDSIHRENIFINKELKEGYPDFAAPVYEGGNMIAVVTTYRMDAEKFTLYYANLFKIIVGLIEHNIVRALKYEAVRRSEIYISDTILMNSIEFNDKRAFAEKQKEEHQEAYVEFSVENAMDFALEELSGKISESIRENDFAGVDEENRVRVILHNALPEDFPVIEQRFRKKGLEVRLW